MGKVRQRLGKAYIHTKEESIQSIIIDALVGSGYDVDVEVRSEERRVGKECRSRWSPYH